MDFTNCNWWSKDEVKNRNGFYADNPKFINKLYKNDILLKEEYDIFLLSKSVENMESLEDILTNKKPAQFEQG